MTRSLRAQPVERDVGFPGEVAGRNQKPYEHHRGKNAYEQRPAIE
jgi:hypothetical protein